ncbi:MAG: hypothetical protein QM813_26395 [Verrucomicrobiota bacterium]
METPTIKKGDKAIHANRGPVTLLSEIGEGPNKGTMVRIEKTNEDIEASSVYLKPVVAKVEA